MRIDRTQICSLKKNVIFQYENLSFLLIFRKEALSFKPI